MPSGLEKYLEPRLLSFLDVNTPNEAILSLIDLLAAEGKVKDKEAFYHAIMEREKIVSTAIGMGVAIPHAKLPAYEDFFIAIGVVKNGIDWHALDGSAVRLVFMIGGPDDKQTEYLQLLSNLTIAIKVEEKRKKLLTLKSKEDIISLLIN